MLKKIFTVPRIRRAMLFTLLMMLIYCYGRTLIIPGVSADALVEGAGGLSVFAVFSLLTGGSLETFSLFSLGVSPAITASIVTELLSNDVIPYLSNLKEEGEKGRKKIQKINKYLGFLLALLQSYSMIRLFDLQYGVLENNSVTSYIYIMIIMAGGSLLLSWIGNLITEYGLGNGLSLIILFGILLSLPSTIVSAYTAIMGLFENDVLKYVAFAIYILILLLIVFAVVYISTGERRIKVTYGGRKLVTGSQFTHIPIKPSTTSVLPLILANSVMTVPLIILSYIKYDWYEKLTPIISIGTPWGTVLLVVLMLLLGLFYGNLVLDPEEISKNLAKNGGYIPSVKPGKETVKYLSKTINHVLLVGIIGLIILVAVPYVLTLAFGLPSSISFGGTSVILIVSIVSELITTLEANLKRGKYKEWF